MKFEIYYIIFFMPMFLFMISMAVSCNSFVVLWSSGFRAEIVEVGRGLKRLKVKLRLVSCKSRLFNV